MIKTVHLLLAIEDTLHCLDANNNTGIISLDLDASITTRLLPISNATLLHYVEMYVSDFIDLVQGGGGGTVVGSTTTLLHLYTGCSTPT